MTVTRWLKLDALNRAWRSFLHAVGAAALLGAGDASWQVLQKALADTTAGAPVDWHQVGVLAGSAALTAFVAPVLAYVHRRWLDPSRFPSAVPPRPPIAPPQPIPEHPIRWAGGKAAAQSRIPPEAVPPRP